MRARLLAFVGDFGTDAARAALSTAKLTCTQALYQRRHRTRTLHKNQAC